MPKFVEQPENLGDLPRLHTEEQARTLLKAGRNKWWTGGLRNQIEFVRIGRSRFYTDAALLAFLQRQTHKPAPEATTRRAAPRNVVPPPPKGRRKQPTAERAST
jgi:hypothetical protein